METAASSELFFRRLSLCSGLPQADPEKTAYLQFQKKKYFSFETEGDHQKSAPANTDDPNFWKMLFVKWTLVGCF